eukprot:TRINITY_DN98483_c0_g1_i1.p1 TRINITY_DN98483_c0_g1~~TRINITY_DN98483_c0_g1_i1.p1  ORF type:complete len:302 (+),score=30.06 TRINITY_DN98483_c0_g1_i1:23-928(+)
MKLLLCILAAFGRIIHAHSWYNESEARQFALISSVGYCEILDEVYTWTCTPCRESGIRLAPGKIRVIDSDGFNQSRFFVGAFQDQPGCLLSFRGSDNFYNFITDFDVWKQMQVVDLQDCQGCFVHRGFYILWKYMRTQVMDALEEVGCAPNGSNNVLSITGHSMGASLTHLAMFDLNHRGYNIMKSYSFEAARVGNQAFADAFNERFPSHVVRITNNMDPVPHLPPIFLGYTHVQSEVFYGATGQFKICTETEDPSCSNQFSNLASMIMYHLGDHCTSPLLTHGDMCHPVGCLKEQRSVLI